MRFLNTKKSAKAHHKPLAKSGRVHQHLRDKLNTTPDAGTRMKEKWYPNRGS